MHLMKQLQESLNSNSFSNPFFQSFSRVYYISRKIKANLWFLVGAVGITVILIPIEILFATNLSKLFDPTTQATVELEVVSFLLALLIILRLVSNFVTSYITYHYSLTIARYVISKVHTISISEFLRINPNKYKSIILTDISNIVGGIIKPGLNLFLSTITIFALTTFLAIENTILFAIVISIFLIFDILVKSFEKKYKIKDSQAIEHEPLFISKRIDEILENPEIIRILGSQNFIVDRYFTSEHRYRLAISRNAFLSLNSRPIAELAGYGSIVIFFYFTSLSHESQIFEFAIILSRLVSPIATLMAALKTIETYKNSASKLLQS